MEGMAKVYKANPLPAPLSLDEQFVGTEDRKLRADRLYISFPVVASHRGHPIQGLVEAVNISWSGMLLLTNFPVNPGDQLRLEFTLPESACPISVLAKVVRRIDATHPTEGTILGVMFQDLDPNVRRMINGYILEHLCTA